MSRSSAGARAPLRAVLFDLDGTLLDTARDFATVVNLMLAERGRAPLPYEPIRRTVSNGARALVRLAFEINEADRDFEPLRQRLLELYEQYLLVETRPFPGIEQLLCELARHGIRWGVVTNKPSAFAAPLLERIGLEPRYDVLVCPDHVQRTKPDPEPLLLACARLGCSVGEALYIGDHARDIAAGRNAGMRTIAATYGYLDPEESAADWAADYYADSVDAIRTILLTQFGFD